MKTPLSTRDKILRAAKSVFGEHGYSHANMRMISRTAGISVGGVYRHFRSKEELYLTLLEEWMVELSTLTRTTLDRTLDAQKAICALIETTIGFALTHREVILLQERELGFSFGLEIKRRFYRERRLLIEQIIEKGVADGMFVAGNVQGFAKVIVNTLRGFALSMIIDEESLFTPQECSTLLLQGLLRRI
ncbi:MAG TPA: TetR/AcrR family transcriptional regulator [Geobacteraceae bacterium]